MQRAMILLAAVVFAVVLTVAPARAADDGTTPATRPAATRPATTQPATTQPADAVGPHDLIVIAIPGLIGPGIEYRKPVRVDAAGRVRLPHIDNLIPLAGLSLSDAEGALDKALRDGNVLANAGVLIDRVERGDAPGVKPGPIAAGDVVRFSIADLSGPGVEYVRTLHVSEAGNIGVPVLGQTRVAGMTEFEAEAALVKAYADQNVLSNAVVSVLRVKPPRDPIPELTFPAPAGRK